MDNKNSTKDAMRRTAWQDSCPRHAQHTVLPEGPPPTLGQPPQRDSASWPENRCPAAAMTATEGPLPTLLALVRAAIWTKRSLSFVLADSVALLFVSVKFLNLCRNNSTNKFRRGSAAGMGRKIPIVSRTELPNKLPVHSSSFLMAAPSHSLPFTSTISSPSARIPCKCAALRFESLRILPVPENICTVALSVRDVRTRKGNRDLAPSSNSIPGRSLP